LCGSSFTLSKDFKEKCKGGKVLSVLPTSVLNSEQLPVPGHVDFWEHHRRFSVLNRALKEREEEVVSLVRKINRLKDDHGRQLGVLGHQHEEDLIRQEGIYGRSIHKLEEVVKGLEIENGLLTGLVSLEDRLAVVGCQAVGVTTNVDNTISMTDQVGSVKVKEPKSLSVQVENGGIGQVREKVNDIPEPKTVQSIQDKGRVKVRSGRLESKSTQLQPTVSRSSGNTDDSEHVGNGRNGLEAVRERKAALLEVNPVELKRQKSKHGILFIGNSNLKNMVENQGLEREAFDRGWEMRMKRGGGLESLVRLLDREGGELGSYEWVVILVGGNDFSSRHSRSIVDSQDMIASSLQRMCGTCMKAGCKVLLVNIPPRRDISWDLFCAVTKTVREVGSAYGASSILDFAALQSRVDYLTFIRNHVVDGVHFSGLCWREMLGEILDVANMDPVSRPLYYSETIQEKQSRLGKSTGCWKCGGDHLGRHCISTAPCGRCGKMGHGELRCVYNLQGCKGCGRWGHARVVCQQGN
jgi:hypothetical protein